MCVEVNFVWHETWTHIVHRILGDSLKVYLSVIHRSTDGCEVSECDDGFVSRCRRCHGAARVQALRGQRGGGGGGEEAEQAEERGPGDGHHDDSQRGRGGSTMVRRLARPGSRHYLQWFEPWSSDYIITTQHTALLPTHWTFNIEILSNQLPVLCKFKY